MCTKLNKIKDKKKRILGTKFKDQTKENGTSKAIENLQASSSKISK